MTKVNRGTKKTQFGLQGRQAGPTLREGFFFKGQLQNPFESIDVDQFKGKRALTGDIEALGSITFRQPQQLLRLAQTTPGKLPGQQPVCEGADGGTDFQGLLPIEIRVAHGVGRPLFRIILVVGGAPSPTLLRVGLDQLGTEVNADHSAIGADLDLFAHILGRNRVQGRVEANVMIGVNGTASPQGYDESFRTKRNEHRFFFGLKHLQGHRARGSVNATPSGISAPMQSSPPDIFQVDEALASEEAFPDEADMAFHDGFILGVVGACRIGKKSTECGIFQEGPVKSRDIGIGQIETGLHAVDDNAYRAPPKKPQGFLESIDDRFEVLPENRNHARESAVAEHHDEGINQARFLAAQFLEVSEAAEIDFGKLSRLPLQLADRNRGFLPKIAPLLSEAVQGRVRHWGAVTDQELVHLR